MIIIIDALNGRTCTFRGALSISAKRKKIKREENIRINFKVFQSLNRNLMEQHRVAVNTKKFCGNIKCEGFS